MIAEVEDVVALGHVLLALATKDLPDVTHKITSQNTDLVVPQRIIENSVQLNGTYVD